MVDGDLGKRRRSTHSIGQSDGVRATATCLLGGCLVVEAAFVPILMMICDGFLLAWVLTELRNAGLDTTGEDRLDIREAIALMPASAWRAFWSCPRDICDLRLAERGLLPDLGQCHATGQLCTLAARLGTDRSSNRRTCHGRVCRRRRLEPGHDLGIARRIQKTACRPRRPLVVVLAMGCAASAAVAGSVYALLLLLPSQPWVLGAADAYAHYVTLPVGLWTLAATIILAEHRYRPPPFTALSHRRKSTGHKPISSATVMTNFASQHRPLRDRSSIDADGNRVAPRDPLGQFLQIALREAPPHSPRDALSPGDKAPRPA